MTLLIQIHTIFAKFDIFCELHNLYEFIRLTHTNPAPTPSRHWGLDKSNQIVHVRSYELATS